ncbi:MAG: S41 family peptidase [Sulfurovum sp.]|nr:S41 family peptidase [Sulfurovum sp.]
MIKRNNKIIMLGFVFTMLIGITISSSSLYAKESSKQQRESKLDSYIKFTQILNLVENQYVDEVNTSALVTKALKGMMTNLDAHSVYMDEKSFSDLDVQTKGEFGGLGIVVGIRDGALTIIAPIDDTPAYKAGVKAGDIILKIDEKATINMTIDEAVKLMRGKPKTPIKLILIRKGEIKPIVVHIIRDIIKIESVKIRTINTDILHIDISSFDAKVTREVREAVVSHPESKGIILDLRNNPGGLLNQAIGVLDLFIDEGILVSQKGRDKKDDSHFIAKKKNTINKDIPIVILVNGGSASASEIVSGAMQDRKRAIVVGKKTFGKGSVQVVIPISNKEGIKLTVARYYLPSGRTIQNKGVTPDISIEAGTVKQESNNSLSIKEKDLKRHLEVELGKINQKTSVNIKDINSSEANSSKEDKTIISRDKLYKDAQLKSATDILKVLIITGNRKEAK